MGGVGSGPGRKSSGVGGGSSITQCKQMGTVLNLFPSLRLDIPQHHLTGAGLASRGQRGLAALSPVCTVVTLTGPLGSILAGPKHLILLSWFNTPKSTSVGFRV